MPETSVSGKKEHSRKAERIVDMKKKIAGIKEGLRVDIHLGSRKEILKKVPNGKIPGHGFWF